MVDRNDIDQQEIAETLHDVAIYIKSRDIGKEHNKLVNKWLSEGGLPDKMKQASHEGFELLIGGSETQDLIPVLIDLLDDLEFFAHREAIEEQEPEAQKLIDRVREFDGFTGIKKAVFTDYSRETFAYINDIARHPSERYTQPEAVHSDSLNSVEVTYEGLLNEWMPVDANTVEARYSMGGNGSYHLSKFSQLADCVALLEEGFQRGGMEVDVRVELGKTYGEDTVVIRASMDEYLSKYKPAILGAIKFDLSYSGTGDVPGIKPYDTFEGFEPDKPVFFGPKAEEKDANGDINVLYISPALVEALHYSPSYEVKAIGDRIKWLRATGFVSEDEKVVPTSSEAGRTFTTLTAQRVRGGSGEVHLVGDESWSSLDLDNKIAGTLWEINHIPSVGVGKHTQRESGRDSDSIQTRSGK